MMEFLGNVVPFVSEMPKVHNTRGEEVAAEADGPTSLYFFKTGMEHHLRRGSALNVQPCEDRQRPASRHSPRLKSRWARPNIESPMLFVDLLRNRGHAKHWAFLFFHLITWDKPSESWWRTTPLTHRFSACPLLGFVPKKWDSVFRSNRERKMRLGGTFGFSSAFVL